MNIGPMVWLVVVSVVVLVGAGVARLRNAL